MKKIGVVAVLSYLFETVEGHCYWVTYVWAKNAIFGKPVIAVLSSGNLCSCPHCRQDLGR